MYQITLGKISTSNDEHVEAAKLATCAQVEHWINTSELEDDFSSVSVGGLSINFGNKSKTATTKIATRARDYLNQQGLLYRGQRTNIGTEFSDSDLHN